VGDQAAPDPGREEAPSPEVAVHELAIAESVVEMVGECTEGRPVTVIRLRVGQLSGVVPDALTFCFELVTAGTAVEGATLEIEVLRGEAHCRSCDHDFSLEDAFLLCRCGSADVQLLSGRELTIQSVEVA
jgi:hydrogenase nickel incorporation protein HypA/HybF